MFITMLLLLPFQMAGENSPSACTREIGATSIAGRMSELP
jgi:hypothetical protein